MKLRLFFLLLSVGLTAGITGAEAPTNNQPPTDNPSPSNRDWENKTVVIPLHGAILPVKFGGQAEEFIAAVQAAQNARRIVVDIDSPGGAVDSCDDIANALLRSKVPTVAVVRHQAVSGGAMAATACAQIFMVKGARIGDVQPMNVVGAAPDERTAEKIEADVRAIMAVNATQNGYPKLLLEAMVSRSFEVYEVRFTDGSREFMTAEEFALRQKNDPQKVVAGAPRIISHKDKLLSLAANEAVELGVATKVLDDFDDIFAELEIAPATVARATVATGSFDPRKLLDSFSLGRGLTLALAVFLLLGVAGTLVEFHTPGFGLPGALGIIGFACFFYLLYSHDRAEWYEMAIFVVGIILLIVEIAVLPGFGVAGVTGAACLVVGLTLAFVPDLSSDYMKQNFWSEISTALVMTFGGLAAAGLLFIALVGDGDKLPFSKRAFSSNVLPDYPTALHSPPTQSVAQSAAATVADADFVPVAATATTDLRPAGKAQLADGKVVDVVSDGSFIEKGRAVEIFALTGGQPVVRAV
ncbi:peptidase [Planctomycetales bacterium]|nr:peptidase [Planctomycetales bacterium]